MRTGMGNRVSRHVFVLRLRLVVVSLFFLGMASCHSQHQPTVRSEPSLDPGWPKPNPFFTQVSYKAVKAELPKYADADYAHDDSGCADCHKAYVKTFATNVHRGESCESCHGPASKHAEEGEPGLLFRFSKIKDPVLLAEACLRCHEQNQCAEVTRWRTSKHANSGVTCVSCHRVHYNVLPGTPATNVSKDTAHQSHGSSIKLTAHNAPVEENPAPAKAKLPSLRGTSNHLNAMSPNVCYRCHGEMADLSKIAGPHQIGGPNGFNCTTCHEAHGQLKESSRTELCLSCHKGTPTMAWHSSLHERSGVACTDCHNPHPSARVPQTVNIDHYQVNRPKRLAMSVQEPEVCFKCHAKIYGLTDMPSHHPIKEGKMVCSDCHDVHGEALGNLKEETVNMVCYRCHAEKQGPFAYEHPPVTERCTICHESHGTVADNLLRQPATFLCLRCHAGHHNRQRDLQNKPVFKKELYTDCLSCHGEIHGSDRPSSAGVGGRFTR
ncbi:MAG: cytochrome c3 family protein [Planctomycetota bacterium]